ncbi:lytic transglycosylase domain-containing protein [Roseovarius sp. TE539]|uniref:lytic transglycosylase domain-containing protein n=1 Tax=Roseovarius sp. TE539 TaxID=2249812 RepID=UPI0026CC1249|nr:lytic transglycosylase domain-containing protein [Roseovarius sp. TE539]
MLRALCLIMLLTSLAGAGAAAADAPSEGPRPLRSAYAAASDGRWDVAARLAARAGPAAVELIEWERLRAGQGTARDVRIFVARNPGWPGLAYMRRQHEGGLAETRPDEVLAFFGDAAPQTGTGALALAAAQRAAGQAGAADATLVLGWRTLDLEGDEHATFLSRAAELLAPHHSARLEMALWRGLRDVAEMLPLVPEAERALARTRQRIEAGGSGTQALIDDLSAEERAHPGIAHAIFGHYISVNRTADAIRVILRQSRVRGGLGVPRRWAGWRRFLARDRMRDGAAREAYDLASLHQLAPGTGYAYADLEWLSGYLALRYLGEPAVALDHFQRFAAVVDTPISRGRAGYWIGRAQEALDDPGAALDAYRRAARFQTSFYGLLAAERGGVPFDAALAGQEDFAPWRAAGFTRSAVYRAGVLALAAGRLDLAERLFLHLADGQDRDGLGRMGAMLAELGTPHLQVMLGKRAARRGIVLPGPYYALHPLDRMDLPVPHELALAIARRESEFDGSVVSGAGAQGLMQLMPGTAREMAREITVSHEPGRVLTDWRYNARLGSAYLEGLSRRFEGNVVMIAAGYNAGPSRPDRWMERFGDPRGGASVIDGGKDVIDWIEHIPFRETRNYVMRVAESLPVYRARLGRPPHPVPFSAELTGTTLSHREAAN